MSIALLQPAIVWRHFATLLATPRPSKHEAAVRGLLARWATARGLTGEIDDAGNLLIRKAASAGNENAPTLALQAHLDMVCQARSGVTHDFLQTPISPRIDGDWLLADDTTLGADNGIGVALALAALEDPTLKHGPLEVLLTVDEEDGMGGAHGLKPGWLKATRMINLDTEAWGELFLGCAGGCDVKITADLPVVPLTAGSRVFTLQIDGLRGGHSGCDIHLRRGNANRLLAEALTALFSAFNPAPALKPAGDRLQLVSLNGGTARNALPRQASALIAVPAELAAPIQHRLDALHADWTTRLVGPDGERGIVATLEPAHVRTSTQAVAGPAARALIGALATCPYGVEAMSRDFPGVVETSNNLGVVALAEGQFSANLMVRSLRDEATRQLADKIAATFIRAGHAATIDGEYPGWTPNPASPLLALCQDVYRRTFGSESSIQVIHAGLECGIIGAKYPGLDTISFGPTITGAHAPGERVNIASIDRCWTLLKALIGELTNPAKP